MENEKLLTANEVAKYMHCSIRSLAELVGRGVLPPPIRFSDSNHGPRFWRQQDVSASITILAKRAKKNFEAGDETGKEDE